MAAADVSRLRSIKIKTGVVKRLAKEKVSYQKERDQQQGRIDKMKTEGKDEYDIRKQEEVLHESIMMIPDCEKRLGKAWEELNVLLITEEDLSATDDFKAAKLALEETKGELAH